MLVDIVRFYISANALIATSFLIALCLYWLCIKRNWLPARFALKAQHYLLAGSILLPLAAAFLPESQLTVSSAQLWTEEQKSSIALEPSKNAIRSSEQATPYSPHLYLTNLSLVGLLVIGLIYHLCYFLGDARKLKRIVWQSIPIRNIGRVRISVSESIATPISFRTRKISHVIIPEWFIDQTDDFKIAVHHELQHHRQGDTTLVFYLQLFTALFFFNPFIHLWHRRLCDIQEFACDEALIGRKDVSAQAYSSCLLKAAEHSLKSPALPIGAIGMSSTASANKLKIRITKMITFKIQQKCRFRMLALSSLAVACLAMATLATHGIARDKHVSMQEAQNVVDRVSEELSFPIEVNEHILRELNYLVSTPERRQFVRSSLERMQRNQLLFERKLRRYNHPFELLAVGIVESGFVNVPESKNPMHAAGVWQFIPNTARAFGLQVDEHIDERLDLELSTDAAMRYLGYNNLRFQDWRLAILSYNAGENRIQRAINEMQSRDPWVLVENGYEGDTRYLARVMAAALILQNPEWVR